MATNQKQRNITDYAHLYIGLQCRYTKRLPIGEGTDWKSEPITGTLLELHKLGEVLILPILKTFDQLEYLTEEQYKELSLIFGPISDAYFFIQKLQTENKVLEGPYDFYILSEATNCLRRYGFDCDNLLQYGLALDWATEHKANALKPTTTKELMALTNNIYKDGGESRNTYAPGTIFTVLEDRTLQDGVYIVESDAEKTFEVYPDEVADVLQYKGLKYPVRNIGDISIGNQSLYNAMEEIARAYWREDEIRIDQAITFFVTDEKLCNSRPDELLQLIPEQPNRTNFMVV